MLGWYTREGDDRVRLARDRIVGEIGDPGPGECGPGRTAKAAGRDRCRRPHPHPWKHLLPRARVRGNEEIDSDRGNACRDRLRPGSNARPDGWRLGATSVAPMGKVGVSIRSTFRRASMGREFPLTPRDVPKIKTEYRRI